MQTIAVSFHIFICIFLIAVILLQAGKGADIGAVFGGASQTLFGGRGPATFLNKLTIIVSVFFLITSVWLTKMGQNKAGESVLEKIKVEKKVPEVVPQPTEAPVAPATPGTETAPTGK